MKQEVFNLLEKYDLDPKKYFGQNFLIDQPVLKKIVQVSQIKSSDNVLEIGPGLGFLTKELAKNATVAVIRGLDNMDHP